VCDRRPEDRHHGVADELLDGSAATLELGAESIVVGPQDCLDVLGVQRFGARREADEVGEQDAHDLPLSAALAQASIRYFNRSTV
jgi:hypothetical protein